MVGQFEGRFYHEGSSESEPATLVYDRLGTLEVRAQSGLFRYQKGEYAIEPPLGSLDRVLHLKGDARFDTSDQRGFKEMESVVSPDSPWKVVAWLENHRLGALACLVGVVIFVYGFLEWGMPAIAKGIAADMPQSLRERISKGSLEFLVERGFGPTELTEERQEAVRRAFERALDLSDVERGEYAFELHLHDGGVVGANAFALPSGAVVATDGFVELCERDEQMLAVFLHEIAHVEAHHGVRAILQQGGVFVVMSILIGDSSSVFTLFEGLPALLMDSRYSQTFEMEADAFAARKLEEAGIGAEAMEEILVLLHADSRDVPLTEFLSSHPGLERRLKAIRSVRGAKE